MWQNFYFRRETFDFNHMLCNSFTLGMFCAGSNTFVRSKLTFIAISIESIINKCSDRRMEAILASLLGICDRSTDRRADRRTEWANEKFHFKEGKQGCRTITVFKGGEVNSYQCKISFPPTPLNVRRFLPF